MNFKLIRFYLIIASLLIMYFGYNTFYGAAAWESNVEKNTETQPTRGRAGYVNRFYHK